jgi:hypothetical protein
VALGAPLLLPATPASAGPALSGTCLLTLNVDYSPPADVLPGSYAEVSITDGGDNTCLTSAGPADVTVRGSLITPPLTGSWGCFSGVANGWIKVVIDLPGFSNPTATTTVANIGSTFAFGATAARLAFEAGGAQDPFDSAACASGASISSTTWIGGLTFQDTSV